MLKRLIKRLTQDNASRRADAISSWVETVEGVSRIAQTEPRTVARIAGVVEGLRVQPREGVSSIEATISDGTGRVTAVWLGRRAIPGLGLGAKVILEGRLGGERMHMQVMNPTFEFAPRDDEH